MCFGLQETKVERTICFPAAGLEAWVYQRPAISGQKLYKRCRHPQPTPPEDVKVWLGRFVARREWGRRNLDEQKRLISALGMGCGC